MNCKQARKIRRVGSSSIRKSYMVQTPFSEKNFKKSEKEKFLKKKVSNRS